MPKPTREDTYAISVASDGVDLGVFDKMTGGSGDSEEQKYRPGAMGPQISLGGSQTTENVVLSRLFDLDRDGQLVKDLFNRRGRALVTITKQPLDIDGNVYGPALVYTGTLKQVSPPEVDSEGGDAGLFSLEVSTNGTVA